MVPARRGSPLPGLDEGGTVNIPVVHTIFIGIPDLKYMYLYLFWC
jgi:hypothetical protein